MQTISKLNKQYKTLFDTGADKEGSAGAGSQRSIDNFAKHFGWMYSTREVATLEGLSMNETYDLPIIQVLNVLVYLKSRIAHDKELMKQYNKQSNV